jgi:hypothetical protein
MTDENLSIAELDDEPDTVYVFGVGSDQPPSVHQWMNDDEGFGALWDNTFDHAEVLVVPGMTGITEVQQTTKDNLEAMLESINTDTEDND